MSLPWWKEMQEILAGEDSIRRLGLSTRTENAFVRSGVGRVSQVLSLLDLPPRERPPLRNVGPTAWAEVAAASERPMLPYERSS